MKPSRRAFTLIELLVVIAIIGLLASIILASLSSARTSATIAAGSQFASTLDNVEGDQAVVEWNLDDCSGTSTYDASGSGNTGTLSNSAMWSTNTPTNKGCSVQLNGSTYKVTGAVSTANFNNQPFTVGAWINPTTLAPASDGQTFISNADFMLGGYFLAISTICPGSGSGDICFEMNSPGHDPTIDTPNGTISAGVWSFVVGVFDGTNMYIYLNGKLITQGAAATSIGTTDQHFTVGAGTQGGWGSFTGYEDTVRAYAKALTASQIGNLYAVEAPAHGINVAER